ncbi:MAG TPA: DUF5131 family protein [Allocoleopsis sp.]
MGLTKIGWTGTIAPDGSIRPGYTFNAWIGCTHKVDEDEGKPRVDPACGNCYAEFMMDVRYGRVKWGKGQPRHRTTPQNWRNPLKWDKQAQADRVRDKVFSLSLGDWLDDEVPIEWLADLLHLTQQTPNLDWLLLTKRIEDWGDRLEQVAHLEHPASEFAQSWLKGKAPANIWMGVTCGDQWSADKRIPLLLNIPAIVRFISFEPLKEEIDITRWTHLLPCPQHPNERAAGWGHLECDCREFFNKHVANGRPSISWGIIGGESNGEETHIEHMRSLLRQLQLANISAFVKQLGSKPFLNGQPYPLSKKNSKGEALEEMPEDMRVQEFPVPNFSALEVVNGI